MRQKAGFAGALAAAFLLAGPLLAAQAADEKLAEEATGILGRNCSGCHSAQARTSDFAIDSRESLLKGGKRGPAIVPGDSAHSHIYQFISHSATPNMPPGGQLTAEEIASIGKWIDAGAPWPANSASGTPAGASWWAFRKPVRATPPKTDDAWARSPIDAFVLAKLREHRLNPAPKASRAELIRRAYLDLTGLPPTAEQTAAFASDASPDAYEKMVDKLLASPRYGEKWARQWLDLVRYADTAGFELDGYNADAWRYRDWVIDSLNKDKPYDRFIEEQIAGDELWPKDPVAKTGTGYFCVGPNMDLYADQKDINRTQTLTDYVDTTGAAFLGLTVGCARCHDHKFDPIPQKDYYRMQAIFEPAVKTEISLSLLGGLGYNVAENTREVRLQEIADEIRDVESDCRTKLRKERSASLPPEVRDAMETDEAKRTPAQQDLVDRYAKKGRVSDEDVRACLSPAASAKLGDIEHQLLSMYANYRPKPFACGVTEMSSAYPVTHIPTRGGGKGAAVMPGFLSALGGGDVPTPDENATTTGRRKALAEWIASPKNPLTARVMVNRIWQGHFGRGIVATASDFGVRGAAPSHPELLDWLAVEFMEHGWSLKQIHREIMLSSTYRQSTEASAQAREGDPENIWLSHMSRRRLTAEEIRDSVLETAGVLNVEMFGRPVVPQLAPDELFGLTGKAADKWIVTEDPKEWDRRSIYLFVRRTYRVPMLEVFDQPESVFTCPRREASTTSTQSLMLLNSDFTLKQAERLSARLLETAPDDAAFVESAWLSVLARKPSAQESAAALQFLEKQRANLGARDAASAELIRSLFNVNEFLYVD